MQERWNEIARLLREARDFLPPQSSVAGGSPAPAVLKGTLNEFEEFLTHNELELAWDALVAVAEQSRVPAACWSKLAKAAGLMQLPGKEALATQHARSSISEEQVLAIARQDAERVYGDLSLYQVTAVLGADGWHVDYELKNEQASASSSLDFGVESLRVSSVLQNPKNQAPQNLDLTGH